MWFHLLEKLVVNDALDEFRGYRIHVFAQRRRFYFYLSIKPSAHLEATQFSGSRKGNQAP